MRNTVFVLSVLAATSVSPALVSGAPAAPQTSNIATQALNERLPHTPRANQFIDNPILRTAGLAHDPNENTPTDRTASHKSPTDHPEPQAQDSTHSGTTYPQKRATDDQTAGGNAYSGSTGDVSSGDITNDAGSGTVTNNGGNTVPQAGQSISGDASGGAGNGHGPGGNAYTGNTGNADGGSIDNVGDTVQNMGGANNAGEGGISRSGVATGGSS